MTESLVYEWKHVQQNVSVGFSSTTILDVFLPKNYCSRYLQSLFSGRYLYCVYCHQWFM